MIKDQLTLLYEIVEDIKRIEKKLGEILLKAEQCGECNGT